MAGKTPHPDYYFETAQSRRVSKTGRPPRVTPDLVQYLKETFPPRCIGPNEDPIAAHRYAAQVELAEKIIRLAGSEDDRPGYMIQED